MPPRSDGHKLMLKCGHAALMMLTFVIMVIGLQVSNLSHYDPRVTTLHIPGGI